MRDEDGVLRWAVALVAGMAILTMWGMRASAAESVELSHYLAGVDEQLVLDMPQDKPVEDDESEMICLGTFVVTGYCSCEICCGKDDGITATGTQATAGRTIAVDPGVIPLGSTVIVGGREFVAEDVGGAIEGNHIDMYFQSHEQAVKWGVHRMEVWIGD